MSEFRTSDIQVASYLYSQGIQFLEVDHSKARKEFIFKEEPKLAELIKDFWSEKALVTPIKLFGAFKEMKNKLYA